LEVQGYQSLFFYLRKGPGIHNTYYMKKTITYPDPWRILSGTGVKIAGIVLMTLDHVHQMFIAQGAPGWLGWFGRPVAVMFLFLCAEGFFILAAGNAICCNSWRVSFLCPP
jgi:hypothetical protein